jgi:hypothetical protein
VAQASGCETPSSCASVVLWQGAHALEAVALPVASDPVLEKVARWSRTRRSDGAVDKAAAVTGAFWTSGYEQPR